MYFPYVRGKQFELILLRDNAKMIAESRMHPIIEPVKSKLSSLTRSLETMTKNNATCTIIVNPQVGQLQNESEMIMKEVFSDSKVDPSGISLGYIMNPNSNLSYLNDFIDTYSNYNYSLLHYGFEDGKKLSSAIEKLDVIKRHVFFDRIAGKLYQRHFKKNGISRILIRDGFQQQKKNANYPHSEHFSDLHITYPDEGMDGFGDFLIVGDDYSETGGPAYAVTIHLTYLGQDQDMFIYHFVSDQTDSPTDPGGKFLEALTKLVKEVKKQNTSIMKTKACLEFIDLHDKQHYPGLGYVKKLSMQHHIELMTNILRTP